MEKKLIKGIDVTVYNSEIEFNEDNKEVEITEK